MENANYRKYAATGLLLILGLALLYLLRVFLIALFGAYVFSFMFSPVYLWINRKLESDRLSALLTILLILVVALIPLLFISYTAFNQALSLQDKFDPQDLSVLMEKLRPGLKSKVDAGLARITEELSNTFTDVLSSIFSTLLHLVVSIFIMVFVMYYIFLNIHYVLIRSTEYLPFKQSNAIWLLREFEHITKAILLGQMFISGLQGMMGGVGFLIFGIPDAALWGIVMAVFSLIPIVGTALIWLPAAIYQIVQRDFYTGIGLLLWGGIVVSHIDNVVRPLIGKKMANINPIVMLLGAFAGLEFFGIIGVVLGPFLLAAFFLLLQVYRQEYLGHPIALTRVQVLTMTPDE